RAKPAHGSLPRYPSADVHDGVVTNKGSARIAGSIETGRCDRSDQRKADLPAVSVSRQYQMKSAFDRPIELIRRVQKGHAEGLSFRPRRRQARKITLPRRFVPDQDYRDVVPSRMDAFAAQVDKPHLLQVGNRPIGVDIVV